MDHENDFEGSDGGPLPIVKNCVVFDLDGTLFNCEHRQEHARKGNWDEFHSRCIFDDIFDDAVTFARLLSKDFYHIVGLTGRNEEYRSLTDAVLHKNKIPVTRLLMRPDGDWRPDHELKPTVLAEYFGNIEEALKHVLVILEDRDKVVKVWRNLGFRCWQVQEGNY